MKETIDFSLYIKENSLFKIVDRDTYINKLVEQTNIKQFYFRKRLLLKCDFEVGDFNNDPIRIRLVTF